MPATRASRRRTQRQKELPCPKRHPPRVEKQDGSRTSRKLGMTTKSNPGIMTPYTGSTYGKNSQRPQRTDRTKQGQCQPLTAKTINPTTATSQIPPTQAQPANTSRDPEPPPTPKMRLPGELSTQKPRPTSQTQVSFRHCGEFQSPQIRHTGKITAIQSNQGAF